MRLNLSIKFSRLRQKGEGVRSKDATPSRSFICDYLSGIIEDEEAFKEVDNDEYLFNIVNNINKDYSLWEEDSYMVDSKEISSYYAPSGKEATNDSCCSGSDSGRFIIDAAKYGNVAGFINHSCSHYHSVYFSIDKLLYFSMPKCFI